MKKISSCIRLSILILAYPFLTGFFSIFGPSNYNKANDLYDQGHYEQAFAIYAEISSDLKGDVQQATYFRLGEMKLDGVGTAKDINAALAYFTKAAEGDDKTWKALAKLELVKIYTSNAGVQANANKAIFYLNEIVAEGLAKERGRAYQELGWLYWHGIAGQLEPNPAKAAGYYQKALNDGIVSAKEAIDLLLDYPEVYVELHQVEFLDRPSGIAPGGMETAYKLFTSGDAGKAFNILQWHAKNGNAEAQFEVANFYRSGIHVDQDNHRSASWFYLSARNGNPKAQLELARLTRLGLSAGGDAEAIKWSTRSGEQGYGDAYNVLAEIAYKPIGEDGKPGRPDSALVFQYSTKAAELGSPLGHTNLGHCYLDGIGVEKNRGIARKHFKLAAETGEPSAQLMLIKEFGENPSSAAERKSKDQLSYTSKADQRGASPLPESSPKGAKNDNLPVLSPVEIYAQNSAAVFMILAIGEEDASQGSAVALTPTIVITNKHVVEGSKIVGMRYNKEKVIFKPMKTSKSVDLYVLQSDIPLPHIKQTRKFDALKVGEKVYAIGSPESLANTISEGIVSGLRVIDGVRYIQTTAPIAHGSSGGALFDAGGNLIGITTKGYSGGGNLNFAISVDEIERL